MTRFFAAILSFLFFSALVATAGIIYVIWHYERDLPEYLQLADYQPPITTRLYAGDGALLAEYAAEKRVFVPVSSIPKQLIEAFIAAEDKTFYSHGGLDYKGLVRAVITNIRNIGSGRRMVGASTITQQVAKNFLLTNEVSLTRKIREAILAFKIEKTFSKDHIMELYLNEIYLGNSSYGVAAAALNYFNKSLEELSLSEKAFLAALPKAPNNYDPKKKKAAAIERRNWVLSRMQEDGYITKEEQELASAEDIIIAPRDKNKVADADYFAEEVRREIAAKYGDDSLYQGGLDVRTSLDPVLQKYAVSALESGLLNYDRRQGYRGAFATIPLGDKWLEDLQNIPSPDYIPHGWRKAVVMALNEENAAIAFSDASSADLPLKGLTWARTKNPDGTLGDEITSPAQVLNVGDVVWVEYVKSKNGDYYSLRQIPEVEGALIALDPHTGRVLALVGGLSFKKSQFNRAVQARRQPGSSFKPFVYLAALDEGYTPSTLILDAPFVMDQGPDMPKWKPSNYIKTFYGPTTLRIGLEKSRNLMTVRLAQAIGMPKVVAYAKKFGIVDHMRPLLSMSLGAGETTLSRLTTGYAMLVNGGKRITPTLVDRIQDRTGATIYRHDNRECPECQNVEWEGQEVPVIPDNREQVVDPRSAYQIVNMLTGVIDRGTASSVRIPGKPLAGKTGTSDDYQDAWFIGFSSDLVVGVFVGYDEPRSLGKKGTGGVVASPIFKSFMTKALKEVSAVPFRVPEGIRLVRVSHKTGRPAKAGDKDVILEAFKTESNISDQGQVIGEEAAPIGEEIDKVMPDVGGFY
ncbi:MAG: penicillin-binding protein 1A [Alphaproteobacteria bacterium]|nr:penicillin-binding protein 1A [Alphaproteobacteria bacterium]